MISKLVDFGERINAEKAKRTLVHDALKEEPVSIDLIIKPDGTFVDFLVFEKKMTLSEAIVAKKGKARLLLDKPEEVLCLGGKKSQSKHQLYLSKLEEHVDLPEFKPVFAFYRENKKNGLDAALAAFEKSISEKDRTGNIAFRLFDKGNRLHEEKAIYNAIIQKYETDQIEKIKASSKKCSICGKTDYPVEDNPHGMIKKVPDGQTAGCALVSYNENAFESYGLKGNYNSFFCNHCAKAYVTGLNWLLSHGNPDKTKEGKEYFKYTNRRGFGKGSDTAMVFWTRSNTPLDEIDILEQPDPDQVSSLINSISKGKAGVPRSIDTDFFYSFTLSGTAARIAVRDWIEMSLFDFKRNIANWFQDTAIEFMGGTYYSRLHALATSCQNKKEKKHTIQFRVASHLWNVALKKSIPPLWMLTHVLKRIRIDSFDGENKYHVTPERAALIRLIINRNYKGGPMIKEKIDLENRSIAYLCGRIFSLMEGIQRAALGKDINAGIRERFFSAASLTPATTFGRLSKMSQQHLTKLKGEKPGLAVVLDRELQALIANVDQFPGILSLEEQGQFAIGYYHQKEYVRTKKEIKDAVEEEINE